LSRSIGGGIGGSVGVGVSRLDKKRGEREGKGVVGVIISVAWVSLFKWFYGFEFITGKRGQ
jgi:hypothetical protein